MKNESEILDYEECPLCLNKELVIVKTFLEKPKGETEFKSIKKKKYFRKILKCTSCGHFLASHKFDLRNLYHEDYASSNYEDTLGIFKTYERIMSLPHKDSDNSMRVERLVNFAENHFPNYQNLEILDIGSGLSVFLGKIKIKTKWTCSAVEPDHRYCNHAKETIGIEGIAQDYRNLNWTRKFHIITLNKVLEHFIDPITVLKKCGTEIKSGGFVYIELPDGENASKDPAGYNRQEFFIDHYHAFSMSSMEMLIRTCGFLPLCLERLREPSRKYTLRAFLTKC
jgi:2-polyprenyl-3-methyl-5-hydroxy-6-metoxy-1,4-benzoquinol methylase